MSAPTSHVLVIGGSRGIGAEVSRAFLAQDCTVSIVSRRPPDPGAMDGNRVRHFAMDLTETARLEPLLDDIIAMGGPLRHAVFLQRNRKDPKDWNEELNVSLGATRVLLEALPTRLDDAADHGIVLVSSNAARFIATEQPIGYHVAKAALEHMARFYAVALGTQGIRVNAVALGAILKRESAAFYADHPELQRIYADITPLGRMGRAEEIASAITFLCGPGASFITGQTLVVDGGMSLKTHESLARSLSPLSSLPITRSQGT